MNAAQDHWTPHTNRNTSITEWRKEEMYADSGATDTVCPNDFSPMHEIKETKESKSGKFYKSANDSKIGVYDRKQ